MNIMSVSKRSISAVLFFMVTIFSFQSGFAQRPESEIEQFIKDYTKAYENITKTRDKQSVLQYVSKDLFSTIIKSNVVDNFGLIQSNYSDLDSYLDQIIRTEGMEVQYSVKDVLRSKVRGKSGVIVCEIGVQISSQGEIWNKGTELNTFVLKKFKNGWKILNFNVVSLEEEQNKGTCMVEVFKGSPGNYMVKTVVPKGSTYESNMDNFEFNPGNGIVYISLAGENTYSWIRDGAITKLAQGNQADQLVGDAIDEYQCVLNIVKLDLYKANCLNFKSKK
jgi:hypothetical protein